MCGVGGRGDTARVSILAVVLTGNASRRNRKFTLYNVVGNTASIVRSVAAAHEGRQVFLFTTLRPFPYVKRIPRASRRPHILL